MPLSKSKGNMYDWVSHTHSHIGGKCPHECVYCSIQDLARRFGPSFRYSGELRLIEEELDVRYGEGKTIFVENCNDLFAEGVRDEWIERVLFHCRSFPMNQYVFQSKNPARYFGWSSLIGGGFPPHTLLGTTVETNRENDLANAPLRCSRLHAMRVLKNVSHFMTFVTIEPIMKFNLNVFSGDLIKAAPDFVNIGADSKGHGLPEPTMAEVLELVDRLQAAGIEVRNKRNLERLERLSST